MHNLKIVITGGSGFIGAHLVKRLVQEGAEVTVLDNLIRGRASRLDPVAEQISLHNVDIRKEDELFPLLKKQDLIIHLAAVNGTENFYKHPDLVLDVGIRGALSVVSAAIRAEVPDLIVASSAEVYQLAPKIPTPEEVPLTLPNSTNPRYSYGCSKIASELIALNYGRDKFRKVQIFRPHNVYGPDMGAKHVIPQFIQRVMNLESDRQIAQNFPIQGSGQESRAFCYVDDIVEGILRMYLKGGHREIYHIGNDEEITILQLAGKIAKQMGKNLSIQAQEAPEGETPRRCPDISKMKKLGYVPKISLDEGLKRTIAWYKQNPEFENTNVLI